MRIRSSLLVVAVACVLLPRVAEADAIIFTDRAAFDAAVQPNALVTFDSLTFRDWSTTYEFPPGSGIFPIGESYCFPAIDCTLVADDILRVSNPADQLPPFTFGRPSLTIPGTPVSDAWMTLADGSNFGAIGFDVFPTSQALVTVTWGDFDLNRFLVPVSAERATFFAPSFVGLLFSPSVRSVNIGVGPYNPNNFQSAVVDNIAIKKEPVPEPATAFMLLVGVMVLLQRRRFMRPK
jgi:hypothetical protein